MAWIIISDGVLINTNRINSIEPKKDKTWVSCGNKYYTIDMTVKEFVKKIGEAEQSSGQQHFAG